VLVTQSAGRAVEDLAYELGWAQHSAPYQRRVLGVLEVSETLSAPTPEGLWELGTAAVLASSEPTMSVGYRQ